MHNVSVQMQNWPEVYWRSSFFFIFTAYASCWNHRTFILLYSVAIVSHPFPSVTRSLITPPVSELSLAPKKKADRASRDLSINPSQSCAHITMSADDHGNSVEQKVYCWLTVSRADSPSASLSSLVSRSANVTPPAFFTSSSEAVSLSSVAT